MGLVQICAGSDVVRAIVEDADLLAAAVLLVLVRWVDDHLRLESDVG